MRIAVDIDSTLYDFAVPMRQAYLDLALEQGEKSEYFKGGYQSWVEWRSPSDVCGFEAFEAALAKVHSPEVILSRQPYEHAAQTLWEVAKQYDILYISNRNPDSRGATLRWLLSHQFPHGELICTMESKKRYIRDCRYIIDDRPKTLIEFVYDHDWVKVNSPRVPQRVGFGLLFEYNRALTDIPNIYLAPTWAGLHYYLEREGVLDSGTYYRADAESLA